jgi:hypothetical protein
MLYDLIFIQSAALATHFLIPLSLSVILSNIKCPHPTRLKSRICYLFVINPNKVKIIAVILYIRKGLIIGVFEKLCGFRLHM